MSKLLLMNRSGLKVLHIGLQCLFCGLLVAPAVNAETNTSKPFVVSLHDCIQMALESNLDISIQRLDPLLREQAILYAKGAFDPTLVISPRYQESRGPLDSDSLALGFIPSKTRVSSVSSGVEGLVPWGTRYNVDFSTTDTRASGNQFQDQYSTPWQLSLTQPLLKDFGTIGSLTPLRLARKRKEISKEELELKLSDIITRVKQSYYDLVYAIENQNVQFQSLDLAAKLLVDDRKRVELGVKTPLAVSEAESAVADREIDLISSSQDVSEKMNQLRSLISEDIDNLQKKRLQPLDHPKIAPLPSQSREEARKTAIAHRADYQRAKLFVEHQNISIKYAENQNYPKLDLEGTYGYAGLENDFGRSVSSSTENDRWSVGLVFRMPLPDRAGKAQAASSKLEKQKAILQLKQIEQNIFLETDNAFERMETSYKRISAAQVATRFAEETLKAAGNELNVGTVDSFRVLELQKKLADAKSREIRSLIDYNIAIAEFDRAQGTALSKNGIELVR
jgi:outer membrane protein